MNKSIKHVLLFLCGIFATAFVFAQSADPAVGYWLNDSKEGKVHIYKAENGKYYGKLIWMKDPNRNGKPKLDEKNKDASLRSRPLQGLLLLKDFNKDGNTYVDGTIYDPQSGKTYSCKMTPKGANQLSIRGFIGVSLIGRTTVWTRTSN